MANNKHCQSTQYNYKQTVYRSDGMHNITTMCTCVHVLCMCSYTTNAANVTAAIEKLEVLHLPCFSHTLQLAVEQALKLPEISKITGRCKRLVAHFNRSPKSYYLLHQKQAALGYKQHSLINDVVTRWNSSYYMIQRVLEQQQPLCATLLELKKGDLMPTDVEFANMELFVQIMNPIVEITEALGAQKYVTISMVRPLLHKLLNNILTVIVGLLK